MNPIFVNYRYKMTEIQYRIDGNITAVLVNTSKTETDDAVFHTGIIYLRSLVSNESNVCNFRRYQSKSVTHPRDIVWLSLSDNRYQIVDDMITRS